MPLSKLFPIHLCLPHLNQYGTPSTQILKLGGPLFNLFIKSFYYISKCIFISTVLVHTCISSHLGYCKTYKLVPHFQSCSSQVHSPNNHEHGGLKHKLAYVTACLKFIIAFHCTQNQITIFTISYKTVHELKPAMDPSTLHNLPSLNIFFQFQKF